MKKEQLEKEDDINIKVCKTFSVVKVIESIILSRIYESYYILYLCFIIINLILCYQFRL